jgi:hypothetical protein
MTTMMSLDRFAALVGAYGASPARWPADARAAAMALMKASAEARRLAEDADRLDRLLDSPETAPVTRGLEDRLLAALADRGPVRATMAFAGFAPARWLPAGALACSLLLGIAMGTQVPRLAELDDEALAQNAASNVMTASAGDGDMWLGGVE